jgi:hypothetical protein
MNKYFLQSGTTNKVFQCGYDSKLDAISWAHKILASKLDHDVILVKEFDSGLVIKEVVRDVKQQLKEKV